jgi:hypothetical protein
MIIGVPEKNRKNLLGVPRKLFWKIIKALKFARRVTFIQELNVCRKVVNENLN